MVVLAYNHDGLISATFKDDKRTTVVTNQTRGFTGATTYNITEYGTDKPVVQNESATPFKHYYFRSNVPAKVNCGSDSVAKSDDVVDAVSRERVQAFAKQHPELALKVGQSGVEFMQLGGKPVTMEQALNSPANFQACPADKRQGVVVAN